MREPFLLTFIAMAFWGFAEWLNQGRSRGWWWVGISMAGMLLVSPAMALALLVLFGGWLWLRGERKRVPWPILAAVGGVFLIGLLFLAWSLSRQHDFSGGGAIGIILNWFRASVKWVIYPVGTRLGPDPECVLENEPADAIFVRGRLRNCTAGIASRFFCAHHTDLAYYRHFPCNRVVPDPAAPVLCPGGSVANPARPRATSVVVALRFFLAVDPDLRHPCGWRPVGQPALSPDLLWVGGAGCRIWLAMVA